MLKYSINAFWSDEDECYVALIPELPGLSAFGDTPEEAVAEAKIAADGFVKVLQEDGCEIPEPKKLKIHSGQTRLRLPKTLHSALTQEARSEGISLNSYIVYLLSERHTTYKTDNNIETIKNILMGSMWDTAKPATDKPTSNYFVQEFGTFDSETRDIVK